MQSKTATFVLLFLLLDSQYSALPLSPPPCLLPPSNIFSISARSCGHERWGETEKLLRAFWGHSYVKSASMEWRRTYQCSTLLATTPSSSSLSRASPHTYYFSHKRERREGSNQQTSCMNGPIGLVVAYQSLLLACSVTRCTSMLRHMVIVRKDRISGRQNPTQDITGWVTSRAADIDIPTDNYYAEHNSW